MSIPPNPHESVVQTSLDRDLDIANAAAGESKGLDPAYLIFPTIAAGSLFFYSEQRRNIQGAMHFGQGMMLALEAGALVKQVLNDRDVSKAALGDKMIPKMTLPGYAKSFAQKYSSPSYEYSVERSIIEAQRNLDFSRPINRVAVLTVHKPDEELKAGEEYTIITSLSKVDQTLGPVAPSPPDSSNVDTTNLYSVVYLRETPIITTTNISYDINTDKPITLLERSNRLISDGTYSGVWVYVRLKDSGAEGWIESYFITVPDDVEGTFSPYTTTKFFLQSISEARQERFQWQLTFGQDLFYVFGQNPLMINCGILLPNNPKTNWFLNFINAYETRLRAGQVLAENAIVSLVVDNRAIAGYIVASNFNQSASAPEIVQGNFTLAVTSYDILESMYAIGVDADDIAQILPPEKSEPPPGWMEKAGKFGLEFLKNEAMHQAVSLI